MGWLLVLLFSPWVEQEEALWCTQSIVLYNATNPDPSELRTADPMQNEVTRETKQALICDEGTGVSLANSLPAWQSDKEL